MLECNGNISGPRDPNTNYAIANNLATLNKSVQGRFTRMWQGYPSTAAYRAYLILIQILKNY